MPDGVDGEGFASPGRYAPGGIGTETARPSGVLARPGGRIRDSDRPSSAVSSPLKCVGRENGVVFAGSANWNSLDDSRYENEDWYSQGILSG